MTNIELRKNILTQHTKNDSIINELLAYNHNPYHENITITELDLQKESEKHLERWKFYKNEANENGVYNTLKRRFPQFQFPVIEGISKTERYRNATLKGKQVQQASESASFSLTDPENLELIIQQTPIGEIPVLIPGNRADFESLVRVFALRNEPGPVPKSMGACTVKGYNNWDRIHQYRRDLEENSGKPMDEILWQIEFKKIIQNKELYQDKFIILSRGPYSNVRAESIGMDEDEWKKLSLKIRLEHECCHYFTLRLFGITRNNLLDELLTDFYGMVKTFNKFQSELFFQFMGLEDFPNYRSGGRMENYLGNPPVSTAAFAVLQKLTYLSAKNIENFYNKISKKNSNRSLFLVLLTILKLGLEMIGSEDGQENLRSTYKELMEQNKD